MNRSISSRMWLSSVSLTLFIFEGSYWHDSVLCPLFELSEQLTKF